MSSPTDDRWERLARDFKERLAVAMPGWTDQNDEDPGVTLVQLFAFLGESLLARTNEIPERGRTQLHDALRHFRLDSPPPCSESTPTRVRYFQGQLLTAADLEAEQTYHRAKDRRHNLLLHGAGIVSGLDVTVEADPNAGPVVTVSPGVAIGPTGEELLVCAPLTSKPCPDPMPCYVALQLADRERAGTPSGEATRVDEVVEVAVSASPPPGQLAIGRLQHAEGGWQVDPTFAPLRSGHPR